MPAIQKIRKHGALLIGVIGAALFAFIAEEFFRSMETTSNASKQQVAEIYGETVNVQDFQQMVNDRLEACKINPQLKAKTMYGQNMGEKTDDEIRDEVWNEYVQYQLVKHEADKLGLIVTDEEVQKALKEGNARSLNNYLPLLNGRYDFTTLQNFLEMYKKNRANAQGAEMEQLETIHRVWKYAESELRKELLMNKYFMLFQSTATSSNPIVAKHLWNDANDSTKVVIATLPFQAITEQVKVTDEDLKKAYEENKEMFSRDRLSWPLACDYRDVKYIDVQVTPSVKDKAALDERMQKYYKDLKGGEVAASRVVATSSSLVPFNENYVTADFFQQYPDVYNAVTTLAVDSMTQPTPFVERDATTTMNIVKLLGKRQVADSIQFQLLPIVAEDAEKGKTRCDSVLKAIGAGSTFDAVAKKLLAGQDSTAYAPQWVSAKDLNTFVPEGATALYNNAMGVTSFIYNDNYFVLNILNRKGSATVYSAAVVKCTLNFSNDTYNEAKNALNIFLGKNKDLASVEKNAKAAGYTVKTIYRLTPASQNIEASPSLTGNEVVAKSKDAVRWVFDDAKEGEMSRIYDCGDSNDHILVVGLAKVHEDGYLPIENDLVKAQLTAIVTAQKKGELAAKKLQGVKSIADAEGRGALKTEYDVTFNDRNMEPKVLGAIAALKEGAVSQPIVGTKGAYVVQVVKRVKGTAKYNDRMALQQAAGQTSGYIGNLFFDLAKKAKVADRRYKF